MRSLDPGTVPDMDTPTFRPIRSKADLTEADLEEILDLHDGFYADDRVDWHSLLDRIELTLKVDLGGSLESEAIKAIKAAIKKHRKETLS